MGLHAPFGYVDYEIPLAELLIDILDKLCSHCHTQGDYNKGCRGCPAGNLVFECRDYILTSNESDKRFELYASDEWLKKAVREPSDEERQKDLKMAEEYKPECDVLRAMKRRVKQIIPHPFFYIRDGKKGSRRPKGFSEFVELISQYKQLREYRLRQWGFMPLIETGKENGD